VFAVIVGGNHGLMFRSVEARQKAIEFIRQVESRSEADSMNGVS
jgi:hypothetical protein